MVAVVVEKDMPTMAVTVVEELRILQLQQIEEN